MSNLDFTYAIIAVFLVVLGFLEAERCRKIDYPIAQGATRNAQVNRAPRIRSQPQQFVSTQRRAAQLLKAILNKFVKGSVR